MRSIAASMLLSALLTVTACDREPVAPPDRAPPSSSITSPSAAGYDDTSDGLVDVRVTWADTADVDVNRVKVRSLRKVSGIAESDVNLLEYWEVERLDSLGLVLHERKEYLLPHGENRLEITAVDRAGNPATDTVSFQLPYAELTTRLITGPESTGNMVRGTYCADENRIYMTTSGTFVIVIEPDSGKLKPPISRSPYQGNYQVLCLPGDPAFYISDAWVHKIDRQTYGIATKVEGSFQSSVLIHSRLDQDRIYAGEYETGGIAIISRAQNRRIGEVSIPWSSEPGEFVSSMALLPNDMKMYVTRGREGGILVIDPIGGAVLKRIAMGDDSLHNGRVDYLSLTRDARTLFAAVHSGEPPGLARIDTRTDQFTGRLALEGLPQDADLSPDERRVFVTTQDRNGVESPNYLIDAITMRVLQEFPRPRAAGTIRFDGPVVFHPSGRWFFVGHNLNVNVYLNRE